jgi:hypothetical protein
MADDEATGDNLAELLFEASQADRTPDKQMRWPSLTADVRAWFERIADKARVSMRLVVASELRAAADAFSGGWGRCTDEVYLVAGLRRGAEIAIGGHPGAADMLAMTRSETEKMIREVTRIECAKMINTLDPSGIIAQARVVAEHWLDQDGINAAEIDKLAEKFAPLRAMGGSGG